MRNKKSLLIVTAAFCSLVAVGTLCLTLLSKEHFLRTFGDSNPYVLNLNRSITSSEIAGGEATFNTNYGNPITFNFDSNKSSTDSGLISLATGSYFSNNTAITGINKIEAVVSGGSATLRYGNDKNNLNLGSSTLDTEGNDDIPFTINLDYPSNYFRISDITGPFAIKNLKVTYSCYNEPVNNTMKAIAIGDVHISSDTNTQQHLSKTLQYVIDNDIDLVLFNGDTVNISPDENYDILDGILEDKFGSIPAGDRPTFFFTMGNHEFYPTDNCAHEETVYAREHARFRALVNKWMPIQIEENENIYSIVVDGITFIAAFPGIDSTWINSQSQLVYLAAAGEFSNNDLSKLEAKLDAANALDSSKPIVVMTHWPWGETYGGPNYGVGSASEIAAMKAVLGKYPQVVNLTSHTHFSNLHDRDIGQSTYTTINVGTHCYGKYVSDCEEDEYGDLIRYENIASRRIANDTQASAQHGKTHFGLGFSFEQNQLLVNRINFDKGTNYSHGTFTIPYGITAANKADKFYYSTGKRSGPSFTFSGNDNLVVTAEEKSSKVLVDVTFKDADQYYAAEGYKVAFENTSGAELTSFKWASLFWADLGQRSTYHIEKEITEKATEYVVKLYPIDFYGHYGTPISVNVVTTPDAFAEYEAKEEATGDLLYASTIVNRNGLTPDHYSFDNYCVDTVNSDSGLSYYVACDEEGTGWPSVKIELPKSFDLTSASVSLSARYNVTHPWVQIKFYNSNNFQVDTGLGIDYSSRENVWQTKEISNSKIQSHAKEGYDFSDIKYLEIVVNFDKYKGNIQSLNLDELHFIETPTLTSNWEMLSLDVGECKGSAASVTYTETYGTSSSARKFTFEDSINVASDGSNQVYACFCPEVDFGSSNGIDAKNCTLSFDIKLSDEFFDNNFIYRHMFELKIVDPGWIHGPAPWLDFVPSGAAGFNKESTDNGWIHFEKDLSQVSELSVLNNTGTIRLRFGFWGLTPTTQQTAYLVFDNLSLVANS